MAPLPYKPDAPATPANRGRGHASACRWLASLTIGTVAVLLWTQPAFAQPDAPTADAGVPEPNAEAPAADEQPDAEAAEAPATGDAAAKPEQDVPEADPKPDAPEADATPPSTEATEAADDDATPETKASTEGETSTPQPPGDARAAPPAPVPPITGPSVPKTICEGKKISKLTVKGHGRVSAADLLATIRLREGLPCSDAEVTTDAHALWDMGYFRDVRVEGETTKSGEIEITFIVKERPAIGEVVIEGNQEVDKSDIEEKITLRQGAILSEPAVREHLQEIRDLYAEKGFFLATVAYKLDKQANNEVTVRFIIDEGREVTIRRIRFLGNEKLTDDELRSVMQTGETTAYSFMTSNNAYRREVFDQDINLLQALYYDHGYLTVEIGAPRLELTRDRHHIDVTINVKEGPRFRVGRVKVGEIDGDGNETEALGGRKQLRESVTLSPGDWFSRSTIAQNLQGITRFYRDRGYAKVDVNPQTNLNIETRIVDVSVVIRRGPLVYVQRINIKGNSKTQDHVLRREARIVEGQLYSQTLVERSKERMTALGFFETVEVSEQDGSTMDRIVINFEVAERPTGSFQLGAGFSSQETLLVTGQVQQQNLLGRGQSLSLNLQVSGIRQLISARFVEPYFLGSNWTAAVEGFKNLRRQQSFDRDSTGGSITFGHPIFAKYFDDRLRMFANYRLEHVDITPATGGAFGSGAGDFFQLYNFIPIRNLFRSGLTSSIRLSLQWDSRNNRLFPSSGVFATVSTEVADDTLASDNNFVRHRVNFRYYYPLIWKFVAKLNTEWGLITSPDSDGVPVFERYFLGGIQDVRGYSLQSLGPRLGIASSFNDPNFEFVQTRGAAYGGNMQFYYNLEIEFPIVEAVGIKGVFFHDAGNAWNLEKTLSGPPAPLGDPTADPDGVHLLSLRTSWGFGIRWFSPLGPLRFEWGFPLNARPFEETYQFQFTVGNAF